MGRSNRNVRGAVLIETVAVIALFLMMSLGLAQQYAVVMAQLRHHAIANELLLGPQERSLALDPSDGSVAMLCDDGQTGCDEGATTPSMTQYLDEIGNFFLNRAEPSMTLGVRLGYIETYTWNYAQGADNTNVGKAKAVELGGATKYYRTAGATTCTNEALQTQLNSYASSFLTKMLQFKVDNAVPQSGVKLYKVRISDTDYEEYMKYVPVGFGVLCTEAFDFLFPQTAITIFPIVPKRLTR
ncbi:MAG: hypothetical protein KDD55_06510 [Bdellovibrionales bacterium]|nr:hypothetical protein [Bdellovibrionales bacterium]